MASPGNPNPNPPFDMHYLFRPPHNPSPPSPSPSPPSAPPQTFPFHHHHRHLPPHPYHPFPLYPPQQQAPLPPSPNPNPNSNVHGARLMALIGASDHSPTPPISTDLVPSAPPMAAAAAPPARTPSSKVPRGRRLSGDRMVYDVDVRLPGEGQPPQLEVTPITKYVSDPGLVFGRQIAVNMSYICYGIKHGAIRVLNNKTALRELLRGHTQRVTDIAFFAEDVHLLASASMDGRIFVWKIVEGPDEENKSHIMGKIVLAIQIVGEGEAYHPRICWHSHKQEVLFVGIGNYVLKIDTTKVGRGEILSAEQPLRCSLDKLINGVQLVGKHDEEVTDLSISQWMITRLVSASMDGVIKIWDDRKAVPLATFIPHDGQPIHSVSFLSAPHRPDHIILMTAGPLNREVKLWSSAGQEGWLLPSDAETWHCTQTLDLRSSAEPRFEESFFNQVLVLPRASLIVLANAKRNAIYAIHVDYGPSPTFTHMDYIAEFTVTMPILSLTGTGTSDWQHVVQVYCVQTQAVQQYALDLFQCLPPPLENAGLDKDSCMSHVFETATSNALGTLEPSCETTVSEMPIGAHRPAQSPSSSESTLGGRHSEFSGVSGVPTIPKLATSVTETNPSAPPMSISDADRIQVSSPQPQLSSELGKYTGSKSPTKGFDQGPMFTDDLVNQTGLEYSIDRRVDAIITSSPDVSYLNENLGKDEDKAVQNDISVVPNPPTFQLISSPKHLVTPSELLSVSASSSETTLSQEPNVAEMKVQDVIVSNDTESVEVEVKVVGKSSLIQQEESNSQKELLHSKVKDKPFNELTAENHCMETHPIEEFAVMESLEQTSSAGNDEVQDAARNIPEKVTEASLLMPVPQLPSSASKGKKLQKTKALQASEPSSATPSPVNTTDSLSEPGSSNLGVPSTEVAFSQILAMQDMLNQLITLQKDMQRQMTMLVTLPVNKEGRRVEAALGRSMEKSVKANVDALWARFQEEDAKHEKQERERVQQITTLISNCVNKDLPAMLERIIKKEIAGIGPAVARATAPVLEKTISSAITESFQRGVGDKAVNQLEKSVSSKLETTVARQIQAQFQTSGKQALQDSLRSSLESSVIPAFEQSCKTMFGQIDATFQKGMAEHVNSAQQQFETAHSPLAVALRDAINSASSFTQTLTSELADGQRKLLAAVSAGGIPKALNPLAVQNNGPSGVLHEIEAPVDPTKELTRLISEHKFEEAFTLALQRSDVSIVSWLCSQVDLKSICATVPLPLSQGVLLSLLQQLACDISNETGRKLGWITDVAVAINPTDPTIALHVRRIFEQVYGIVRHQSTLPGVAVSEAGTLRIILHVLNSVLMSCK